MNEKTIQVPVTWDSANRKKDKSISLRFTSNFEVSHEDFAEMDKVVGNAGWLLFKQNESFKEADIPKEDAPDNEKKPSQRLRGVLFRVWEQQKRDEDFEVYYRKVMDQLIEKYKDLLV